MTKIKGGETIEYTLTLHGTLTVNSKNFNEIKLNKYRLTDLDNLIIENVKKREKD